MSRRYIKDQENGELITIVDASDYEDVKNVIASYNSYETVSHRNTYVTDFMTFDIETTSLKDRGFMYLWGACIGDDVIIGRTWEQAMSMFKTICDHYLLSDKRYVIYCHNLSFEFQFLRNFFEWNKVFATDKRKPITALTGGLEFRCSYKLTNMSLAKFCEQSKSCVHYKKDGEKFDYTKIRYPDDELDDYQYLYQYCDVKGLHESLEDLLEEDDLATIPITSTGYVRRDARKAMLSNPANKALIKDTQLDIYLYLLMRTSRRGGDTHGLAQYVDEIMYNVDSWDITSSYPYVMMCCKYPVTPFIETSRYIDDGRAYLMEVRFLNLRLKSVKHMPYLPVTKTIEKKNWRNDNGRIITAQIARTILTDIDMHIMHDVYDWDDVEYIHIYSARYGYLPKEYRKLIGEWFQTKTDLKGGDPYYYLKSKNKINALFGMMLTDICQLEYVYEDGEWNVKDTPPETLLTKYYKSHNSFLAYQWGLWVTAHARYRLHEPMIKNLGYGIYSDTDSWKLKVGYDRNVFETINKRVMAEAETYDVKPYAIKKDGTKEYLGVWSYEGCYKEFKTLGAKKYAYKDGDDKIHVTVSGLNKKKGAELLTKKGGLKAFKDGLVFSEKYSGRTYAVYNDVKDTFYENIDGHVFLSGSSVAIHETTYVLGKTEEYKNLLNEIREYGISMIE